MLLGTLCAAAYAAPPPAAPSPPAAAPPTAVASTTPVAPDEGFLEFLGSDDVGDTAWWEFLKKAPLHGNDEPVPAPQEAKR